MLYSDALEGFWLARKRDYSPHTVSDYQLTYKRLQAWVGKGRHIETITNQDIDSFLQDLAETHQLAAKTRLNAWVAALDLGRDLPGHPPHPAWPRPSPAATQARHRDP